MRNLQHRRLIIGGHDVGGPQRYPYYVAIDKNNGVIVSGALIAPDIVLSAGHVAMDAMNNITIKIGPFAVHESESFAETIPLKSYLLYSNWQLLAPGMFAEDYMLFRLAAKSTHKPVRINRNASLPAPGQIVKMMGLGWTNESHKSPASKLQEVELLVISNQECEAANDPSRPATTYQGMIVESMICTKSPPNTTRDGCAWDSGDPVILAGQNAEEDVLVALGSTGAGCADPFFPAIQARIATEHGYGLQWIREQVCKLSTDPPEDFDCSQLKIKKPRANRTKSTPKAHKTPRSSSSSSKTTGASRTKSKPRAHRTPSSGSSSSTTSSSSSVIEGASMVNFAESGTEFLTADSVSVGCLLMVLFLVAELLSWRKKRNTRVERLHQVALGSPAGQNRVGYGSMEI